MTENNSLAKKEESEIVEQESTLLIDVAGEMKKGYDIICDIIDKLLADTRTEEIRDDEGNVIGQRTHLHPQLIKWFRESRLTKNDMWKLGGGEIAHEAEKKKLEIKAKLVMDILDKDPEKRDELIEKWKKQASFKS